MTDLLPTPSLIRSRRIAAGFTQRHSADLCGVALGTWACWERGTRQMPQLAWNHFQLVTQSVIESKEKLLKELKS